MHPFGAVVVESDHRLNGNARRIGANEPDIAPHRLDVVEHPGFVALLFLDALVELVGTRYLLWLPNHYLHRKGWKGQRGENWIHIK